MTNPKVIIVTGANRGIGRAICTSILSRPHGQGPIKLFATSRKGEDLGLSSSSTPSQQQEILYPKLDVADRESVRSFVDAIRRQHSGSVDVLINNAGVNLEAEYGLESARRTLEVNYWGTVEMCQSILPLLTKPTGRIVNLSSVASSVKDYSEAIQQRFRDPHATLQDLDKLAEEYLHSVRTGREAEAGFYGPGRSYNVSKALVNAYTSLLARSFPDPPPAINCCCPGWIATDMGRLVGSKRIQPPKTPEEGARIPVRLALDELPEGATGLYWANDSIRSKETGSVQEW